MQNGIGASFASARIKKAQTQKEHSLQDLPILSQIVAVAQEAQYEPDPGHRHSRIQGVRADRGRIGLEVWLLRSVEFLPACSRSHFKYNPDSAFILTSAPNLMTCIHGISWSLVPDMTRSRKNDNSREEVLKRRNVEQSDVI